MDKRAGKMSLEDIAGPDVYTRPGHQPRVHHIHLKDGHCQPHKAIFGANAFQHESKIHQEGTIKDKSIYEIMTPNSIGLMQGDLQSGAGIVFGKHSGRIDTRLCELGYNLDISKLNAIFTRFREVADKKKGTLDDGNLESLVSKQAGYINDL
jgi:2-isopropylmalate synthase